VKTTTIQSRPEGAARIQKLRAANALLLAVLIIAWSPFFFTPTTYIRAKLDSHGHPLTRDGRPLPVGVPAPISDIQMERDFLGEIQSQWPGYSMFGMAAFFIVRAAVIRFRPSSMPQRNDRNASSETN
jgi:hypothetical protein